MYDSRHVSHVRCEEKPCEVLDTMDGINFLVFVQVYRLVTEDTIEEKVVERAQQKLKLDAMVVQRGMLQGEKKLEKNELLAAIR